MDIEGNEYETIPDILQHGSQITGIVLEIHFEEPQQIAQALRLLQSLDQNFLLVHLHGNNYCTKCIETSHVRGSISRVLELTYIHRSFVHHYEVSRDQVHPTPIDFPNDHDSLDNEFTILE